MKTSKLTSNGTLLVACLLAVSGCSTHLGPGYACPAQPAREFDGDGCTGPIVLDARRTDNPTGIMVRAGQRIFVDFLGDFDPAIPWQDSWISATPQGGWTGPWRLIEPLVRYLGARHKGSPMFALTCQIGREATEQFYVAEGSFPARKPGELSCFANDWPAPKRYENNSGCIRIHVCLDNASNGQSHCEGGRHCPEPE